LFIHAFWFASKLAAVAFVLTHNGKLIINVAVSNPSVAARLREWSGNRHRLRQHLLDLAGSRTFPCIAGRDWNAHLAWLCSMTDSRFGTERDFLSTPHSSGFA
jgi:hypothetical protein